MAKRAKQITNPVDPEFGPGFDFGETDKSLPENQNSAPTSSPELASDMSRPPAKNGRKVPREDKSAEASSATFKIETSAGSFEADEDGNASHPELADAGAAQADACPASSTSAAIDAAEPKTGGDGSEPTKGGRLVELRAATALSALIAAEGDALEIIHPHEAGEERVALGSLHRWHAAPSERCDFSTLAGKALLQRAVNPDALPPIGVALFGNALTVIDAFDEYDAVEAQHGDNPEQLVRVIRFDGTEADALLRLFQRIFLNRTLADIDRAAEMAATKAAHGLSNVVIVGMLGWPASKVTKWVTAGIVYTEHRAFFDLLDGSRPKSIDYGYQVGQALQAAAKLDRDEGLENDRLVALLDKRDALLAEGKRFEAPEARAALGIGPAPKIAAEAAPKPIVAVSTKAFATPEGRDAGAAEVLTDGIPRLRFPTVEAGLARGELAKIRDTFMEMAEEHIGRHLFGA